jgi:hypothetical protein
VQYVLAVLFGLVGLVLGWAVAAFGTLVLGSAFGLSDFEGERAMTAFFAIGPLGGLIGMVLGIWLARGLRAAR